MLATAKRMLKDSKTSKTLTHVTDDATFYAVFSGDPRVTVTPVAFTAAGDVVASEGGKVGDLKPSKVKITVTTAGKAKQIYSFDWTILPLPAWAAGTFDGAAAGEGPENGESGVVSLTLYAPAKKGFAGWCRTIAVKPVFDGNVVTDVTME